MTYRTKLFALGALAFASPSLGQPTAPQSASNPVNSPAAAGSWTYTQVQGASDAIFRDSSGAPQLTVRCNRATRRVMFIRPASAAAPTLQLWTSSDARSLAATYDQATARISAEVPAFDRLLDALAFSRARFAVGVPGGQPLVVPNWPEPTRAIEDCRN
jgi:hypothetical protein